MGDGGLDHPKCKASWLLMHTQVAAAKIPLSPPVRRVHNEETVSAGQGSASQTTDRERLE